MVINSLSLSNVALRRERRGGGSLFTVHKGGTRVHDPSTVISLKAFLECLFLEKHSKIRPHIGFLPLQTLYHFQAINRIMPLLNFMYLPMYTVYILCYD